MDRAVLEVDLDQLKKNCLNLKKKVQAGFFCPVIKDQAYGHGLLPVAKALQDIDIKQVAVVSQEEARELREAGIKMGILILGPVLNSSDMRWICSNQVTPVLSNWQDLKDVALEKHPHVHLKFDTGLSRLGWSCEQADEVKMFLDKNPHIICEGICSHLISNEFSDLQIAKLNQVKKIFPKACSHVLNTSSAVDFISKQKKLSGLGFRPGISLYGHLPCSSYDKKTWQDLDLQPCSELKSYIIDVRTISKGDRVSYGGHYQAKEPSVIATVSMGYSDGLMRSLDQGFCLFRNKKARFVGDICMDFFMLDISSIVKDAKEVKLGEEVIIFNKELSVLEQASQMKTIPYEFFVKLGSRVKRKYKG